MQVIYIYIYIYIKMGVGETSPPLMPNDFNSSSPKEVLASSSAACFHSTNSDFTDSFGSRGRVERLR